MSKVTLKMTAPGRGEVFIDDRPIPEVRGVKITAGVEQLTFVELELIPIRIECNLDEQAVVRWRQPEGYDPYNSAA